MQNAMRETKQRIKAAVAVMAAALLIPATAGALTAEPATVTFHAQDDTVTITLRDNGAALNGAAVTGWKLMASGHDYNHMLDVQKTADGLVVSPTNDLEMGTYDLVVSTRAGSATVDVRAPLTELKSIVDEMAAKWGISTAEAKDRLGMKTTPGTAEVDITVPATYYEGQSLSLDVPMVDNELRWLVNGKVVEEGPGATSLAYTFEETGNYVITVQVLEDGTIVGSDSVWTTVAPRPAVAWSVRPGREFTLDAPFGYATYMWKVDGEVVGTGRTLTHRFQTPGTYDVTCKAQETGAGSYDVFRWLTVVSE
jgi:hypothetical protein